MVYLIRRPNPRLLPEQIVIVKHHPNHPTMKDQNSLEGKMLEAINMRAVITNKGTGDVYAAKACAQIAIDHAALSTRPTKHLYEAVPVEKVRTIFNAGVLYGSWMENAYHHGTADAKTICPYPNVDEYIESLPTRSTQVQEGEVEKLREALKATHKKFNELVKAMIKDMLLPEKQIDECCQILEANNVLLFDKSPISHE